MFIEIIQTEPVHTHYSFMIPAYRQGRKACANQMTTSRVPLAHSSLKLNKCRLHICSSLLLLMHPS